MKGLAVFFTGFVAKIANATRDQIVNVCEQEGWEPLWLTDRSRSFYLRGANSKKAQTSNKLDKLNTVLRNRLQFILRPSETTDEASLSAFLTKQMKKAPKTVFFGSSGGGYGAIHYGERLRPDAVITFSPFTAFDVKTMDLDGRGTKILPNLWSAEKNDDARNPRKRMLSSDWDARNLSIYFPVKSDKDELQAGILYDVPGVEHIGIDSAHHNLADVQFPVAEVVRWHLASHGAPQRSEPPAKEHWFADYRLFASSASAQPAE